MSDALLTEPTQPNLHQSCIVVKKDNPSFELGNGHEWNPIQLRQGQTIGEQVAAITALLRDDRLAQFRGARVHFMLTDGNTQIALEVGSFAGAVAYAVYHKNPSLLPERRIRPLVDWKATAEGDQMPIAELLDASEN